MWLDDFRRRTAWNTHANERQYDAPAKPWRFVHVDPHDVEYFKTISLLWGLGRVRGGNWDLPENCRRIDELYILKGLAQRFKEGRKWTDTAYYETAVERLDEDGQFHGCETSEEFREGYLPALDDLYVDMRENGYRPNRGIVYDDPEDAEYIHDLEPMILVGRNGEIIWSEGYHRLVVARLLDVDSIPVYVIRRHEEWQEVRDRVASSEGRPSDRASYADHPDLRDL